MLSSGRICYITEYWQQRSPDNGNKPGAGLEGGCDKNESVQISGDKGARVQICNSSRDLLSE